MNNIRWEKREKFRGSSVTEWVMSVNGVSKLYMRKFSDGRSNYSSYQIFDITSNTVIAQFWKDSPNWKDAQAEMLKIGGVNRRGGLKEAQKFGIDMVLSTKN